MLLIDRPECPRPRVCICNSTCQCLSKATIPNDRNRSRFNSFGEETENFVSQQLWMSCMSQALCVASHAGPRVMAPMLAVTCQTTGGIPCQKRLDHGESFEIFAQARTMEIHPVAEKLTFFSKVRGEMLQRKRSIWSIIDARENLESVRELFRLPK
jgi:hypothetical protein